MTLLEPLGHGIDFHDLQSHYYVVDSSILKNPPSENLPKYIVVTMVGDSDPPENLFHSTNKKEAIHFCFEKNREIKDPNASLYENLVKHEIADEEYDSLVRMTEHL